jgi:hypothetical protein
MSNDHEAQWLREQMQELRQRRGASGPTFERVWGAARVRRVALEAKPAWPAWTLAASSFAAVLLTTLLALHIGAERKRDRQQEREFATVDGVLMTYWQAPSDDLLPISNGPNLPNRDE